MSEKKLGSTPSAIGKQPEPSTQTINVGEQLMGIRTKLDEAFQMMNNLVTIAIQGKVRNKT